MRNPQRQLAAAVCAALTAIERVKGRKRHILVDTLGPLLSVRVFPADEADQQAGASLLAGLPLRWPTVRIIFADGGHEGRALAASCIDARAWNWGSFGAAALTPFA